MIRLYCAAMEELLLMMTQYRKTTIYTDKDGRFMHIHDPALDSKAKRIMQLGGI